MSLTISIGTTADPYNKIAKTYTESLSLSCVLKEQTSVIDPIIIVDIDTATAATLMSCNYAYIADFGRYYYVRNIKSINASLWEITLHVDVLKTYSGAVMNSPCIVAKSYDTFNMYLNDPNYKCYQDDYVIANKFDGGFPINKSKFVLTIFGDKEVQT